MPTTYGSSTYNAKTYGKRSLKRGRKDEESLVVDQDDSSKKRQKVGTEQLEQRSLTPEANVDASQLRKPTLLMTYGTPKKSKPSTDSPSPRSTPTASPSQPPKLARDLSQIFAAVTPTHSPSPSPKKLAKRMLARSKTESSIDSQFTNDNSLDRTPSLPNFPSSSSQRKSSAVDVNIGDSANALPFSAPAPVPTTTRTYAGKSRSFLVALPSSSLPADALHDLEQEEDDYLTRESYSSLRTRWGVDNSEDDPYSFDLPSPKKSNPATPDASPSKRSKGKSRVLPASARPIPPLPNGLMNPLKSITELRNKGESRRFLDEVGYLFEGMDPNGGVELRRASALEITTKLCNSEFSRKAKATDFFRHTWDLFLDAGAGKGHDKILDTLLVFFASLVARDATSLADLAQRRPSTPTVDPTSSSTEQKQGDHKPRSFVDTLFTLLEITTAGPDPLKLVGPKSNLGDAEFKKFGFKKKDRGTLTTIYKAVATDSCLFPSETPISTSLLITQTLQAVSPSLIPTRRFPTLLASLRVSLASSTSISSSSPGSLASSLHLQWREAMQEVPYLGIYHHLKLLDTYLLSQWESDGDVDALEEGVLSGEDLNAQIMEEARDEWLVDDLVALGVCAENQMANGTLDRHSVRNCLEITLRVLVNLTHGDELWGEKVVQNTCAMNLLMRTSAQAGRRMVQGKDAVRVKEEVDMMPKVEDAAEGSSDSVARNRDREETHALDQLCLALGLLTNLVQVAPSAKDVLRETRLDPSCTLRKRSCLHNCTCPNAISALEILMHLYIQQQPPSSNTAPAHKLEPASSPEPELNAEADASFLRGHLAVLFGLLMRGSPVNQTAILACLPTPSGGVGGKGSDRIKLNRLVDQAREFVAFFAVVSGGSVDGEKESKVARDIVRFLEQQRDVL